MKPTDNQPKKSWTKPRVMRIRAGAAELGDGFVTDSGIQSS